MWYRAVGDPDYKRIFCLVNGEKLSYQVCTKALEEMDQILKGKTGMVIMLIMSSIVLCSTTNTEIDILGGCFACFLCCGHGGSSYVKLFKSYVFLCITTNKYNY